MTSVLRFGTPADAGMSEERIDRVGELCRSWVERDVHKALAVLVARRGTICLYDALGALGPHGAPPLKPDSIFPLMSISKVVTATALMILVENGVVGLTRPVQEYIPEFAGDGRESVLVHHLLTHTTGLQGRFPLPSLGEAERREDGQSSLVVRDLDAALALPLVTKPGDAMFYCNANYSIAGELVRRVAGEPLGEFALSRLFEPLGMRDSSYGLPANSSERAIGWSVFPPSLLSTTSSAFRHAPFPAAGVHSTTLDMAVLAQMFINRGTYGDARVLSPYAAAEMTRNQIPGIRATFGTRHAVDASWGYGWGIAGDEKWPNWPTCTKGTFAHSGAGAMMLWADPALEIVGVYFSIGRYRGTLEAFEAVNNRDLFVNAVNAAVLDD